MRTALIQFNPTVGDLAGNTARMAEMIDDARAQGAELVVFPELAVCGYPPRDLLLHEGFVAACADAAKALGERHSAGLTLVFGCPLPVDRTDARHDLGSGIANSLLAYYDGAMVDYYDKRLLPTYDVFDEPPLLRAGRPGGGDRRADIGRHTPRRALDLRRPLEGRGRGVRLALSARRRSRRGPGRGRCGDDHQPLGQPLRARQGQAAPRHPHRPRDAAPRQRARDKSGRRQRRSGLRRPRRGLRRGRAAARLRPRLRGRGDGGGCPRCCERARPRAMTAAATCPPTPR
ncbi:MAG: hypothetical protein HND58_18630 [Planctomycetota bacterium]|nr:MAG: hypothetical protein HND58_18630 [Planctomycetota bacterium]